MKRPPRVVTESTDMGAGRLIWRVRLEYSYPAAGGVRWVGDFLKTAATDTRRERPRTFRSKEAAIAAAMKILNRWNP